MSAFLSTELGQTAGQTAAPVGYKPEATAYQARLKRIRATFTLASQATTDTLVLGVLPVGCCFAGGELTSSVTLGSSTLAVGNSSSSAKYHVAATVTTADAPSLFGLASALAAGASTSEETVIATIAAAALPAAGTLVFDIYYSMP